MHVYICCVKVYDVFLVKNYGQFFAIFYYFLSIFGFVEFLGLLQVTKEKVLEAIQGHVLGEAVLIAIF